MQDCQRPNATQSPAAPKLDLAPAALAYLGKYAASTAHLRQILRRKAERRIARWATPPASGHIAEAVEAALARATALGLLNDREYATSYARQHRARGESRGRIRARLKAKGLAPDDIAAALAPFETDETKAATRFAQRRRLGPYRMHPGKPDQRQRDIAALCRAGFSFQIARSVIDA